MVLIPKRILRQFRFCFLVSALLSTFCFQFSFGNTGLNSPDSFTSLPIADVMLVYAVASQQQVGQEVDENSQPSQSGADVISGVPSYYIWAGLLLSITLFSIFRWRDKQSRANARKEDIKASKKKQEIGAVARKLQKRLPENRIVRDRVSSTAPRIRSKPAEAFTASPFSIQRHANNPKILVIDESRSMRTALANQIHRYYSVLESDDLNDALRITRIARPSLVILGSHTSKKESTAFCRKLKSDSALWHIPILLLASTKKSSDSVQLTKVVDDYLMIPLQPEELLVAVENLVDVRGYLKDGGLQRPRFSSEDSTTQISDTMFLDAVHTVVENNLSNSLFGLETLAQEVNVSIRQLHGRLRQLTRLSPAGFIRTKRLKQASELLSAGKHNVQEIARMVGFHSPEYFKRVFVQAFGVPPAEFRSS